MTAIDVLSFADALAATSKDGKRKLLLGNGFSRAWRDDLFSYGALLDQANFARLSPHARAAFDTLGTTDFEVVMRALRSAAALIRLYGGSESTLPKQLVDDAEGLREVLVQTIAGRHPDRPGAVTLAEYGNARAFLSHFESIYTVNYDLLLYWALMQDEIEPKLSSDDGFRTPDEGTREYVTWDVEKTDGQSIFYLHGGLHLFDGGHELQKYTWKNTGIPLMEQIRGALAQDLYPLFVSEGESDQKLSKIKHSDFLSRAYRSFSKIGGSLFVYGHSMSLHDEHIVKMIEKNKVHTLCVGLFGDPASPASLHIRERCDRVSSSRPPKRPLTVRYYDASTAAVWRGS